ncbi:TMhelix containing protein [Vibrio phage 141O35-1]|nr:TMhelix containing protein [Vibrio phage 141O35-1]CAH9015666.1 TMhelix containing protein [Vibrio phage 141E35-1]
MGHSPQLHDRNSTDSPFRAETPVPSDTAMMLGQMMAELKGLSQQMAKTSSEVHNQTQIIHDNQLEMGRYYAGLELANKDIQEIRDNQRAILSRLDETVSKVEFHKLEAHVKTLNGTDAKFRTLGIDINDPKSVEAVRRFIDKGIESNATMKSVTVRVLQAVAVALVLAVCAAAWNGGVKGMLNNDTRQEQER